MSYTSRSEMATDFFSRWGHWRNPRRHKWQRWGSAKRWEKKESDAGGAGGRRQVKDHCSNVQRRIFLHHWELSWVREHAWLTPANRAAQEIGDVHRHRWSCQRHTVCLPALLFPRGQLCDSQGGTSFVKKPLDGSGDIRWLPFRPSISTNTSNTLGRKVFCWLKPSPEPHRFNYIWC